MTRTVKIDVVRDEDVIFGVAQEHRADLPKTFNDPLQEWVVDNFDIERNGTILKEAAEMEYVPNEEVVGFRELD